MHLDDTTLDAYLVRSLDAARLTAIDGHIGSCLPCALAVEAAALDPRRWERRGPLGRLVRVTPPPVPAPALARELQHAA
ncbi:MAG: hypothetical protein JWM06_634 [Actinomycetia bacterium]|jgi:hypothetical protein|nr:hypothetical protein [Actinomycetes bacterium]